MGIEYDNFIKMMSATRLPREVQTAQDAIANIGRDICGGINPIRELKERMALEQRDSFISSEIRRAKDTVLDMRRQTLERMKESLGVMSNADRLVHQRQKLNEQFERMGAITKSRDTIERLKAFGMGNADMILGRRAQDALTMVRDMIGTAEDQAARFKRDMLSLAGRDAARTFQDVIRRMDRETEGTARGYVRPPRTYEPELYRHRPVALPKVELPNPAKEWIAETHRAEQEQRSNLLTGQCLQMSGLVSGREFRVTGADAFTARTSTSIEINVLDETGGTQTVTAHPSAIGLLFSIINITNGGTDTVH